ncbi:MAG: hypothetical protein CMF74_06810 [Maricaulis sp.]|nr:hypothetical protein [Maricaulis sp.]
MLVVLHLDSMVAIESTELPISELTQYEKNSRTHSDDQIKALAEAIKRFGFTQPIICDESKVILAGHGRYLAARQLGLKVVPCRVVTSLTDQEKKAYIIADNKIAEISEWNEEHLLAELNELQDFDADDNLAALFDLNTFVKTKAQQISIDKIKPHPRNYKVHPPEQLEHLQQSIKENGIYRNILVANDFTILAGHGIVEAAKLLGLTSVPILRLDLPPNSTKSIKILTADNEVTHLAETNMREMSELLKELLVEDDLLGTGYDKDKIENLLMVSRSKDEVKKLDDEDWGNYMDFQAVKPNPKLIINFENEKDREDFGKFIGAELTDKTKYIWWPFKEKNKFAHLNYVAEESNE